MNIITNNCLGGFIYRDILKCEYQNPFIWTGIEIKQFIDLVDNFEKIDFNNVMIEKKGKDFSNNFYIIIDDKYAVRNVHIYFDANENIPKRKSDGVYYNKPWEYIYLKYIKRIKKMDKDIRIGFYDKNESTLEDLIKLSEICKKRKYKCLIITDKIIESNEFVKFCYFNHKDPWFDEIKNKYKNEFEWLLK